MLPGGTMLRLQANSRKGLTDSLLRSNVDDVAQCTSELMAAAPGSLERIFNINATSEDFANSGSRSETTRVMRGCPRTT